MQCDYEMSLISSPLARWAGNSPLYRHPGPGPASKPKTQELGTRTLDPGPRQLEPDSPPPLRFSGPLFAGTTPVPPLWTIRRPPLFGRATPPTYYMKN